MEIPQVQTQQAVLAKGLAREGEAAANVTQEAQVQAEESILADNKKFDTLTLTNEGKAQVNNAEMENADTKSNVAGSGGAEEYEALPLPGTGNADEEVEENQRANNTEEEKPVAEEETESDYGNLSGYTKQELEALQARGAITKTQLENELQRRGVDML